MTKHEILNTPTSKEQIKIIGIIHFVWNVFSGGVLGTLLVVWYLLIQNNITPEARTTIYNIINFNVSFLIYFFISGLLMFVLIGFITTPILFLIWLVSLIIWFIKHLWGEEYGYTMSIKFLK